MNGMIKGVGKQIVVIKNPKSEYFEQAIFIIKDGLNGTQTDMLEECERIIKNSSKISFKTSKIKNRLTKAGYLITLIIVITAITVLINILM